jgi:hypothetical protein
MLGFSLAGAGAQRQLAIAGICLAWFWVIGLPVLLIDEGAILLSWLAWSHRRLGWIASLVWPLAEKN